MSNLPGTHFYCLLLVFLASTAVTLAAQQEKTVWVQVTDSRGNPLPNISLKEVSWGKTVTTTNSGKAGVPVPVTTELGSLVYIVVLSRHYTTLNGWPIGVRVSSFNKPHQFSPITLIGRNQQSFIPKVPSRRQSPQSDTESDPFQKGSRALAAQQFQEAEAHFRKSAEIRKRAYERLRTKLSATKYAEANTELGVIYMALNKWIDAYERLQEAVRMTPDDETKFLFGIVAMTVGDLPKAELAFREMASSQRRGHGRLAGSLFASKIYKFYGKLDESSRLERQFSKQFSTLRWSNNRAIDELLKVLNEVTDDIINQPKVREKSRSIVLLALTILHKANIAFIEKTKGAFSPELVEPLHSLASVSQIRKGGNEAEPLLKRSITIQERLLGREHIWVAYSYELLADFEMERGAFQEAEKYHREAAKIFERSLGNDNAWLDMTDASLALLYKQQQRFEEAEEKWQGLKHRRCAQDKNNMTCLRVLLNLSEFYSYQDKYPEAIASKRQALDLAKRLWAARDPIGTAIILEMIDDLEDLYSRTNQQGEAQELKREKQEIVSLRVLPAEEAVLPTEEAKEDVKLSTAWNIAVQLNGSRCSYPPPHDFVEYPKTKRLLEAAQRAARHIDSRDPDVAELLFMLGATYHSDGQFDQAKQVVNQAIKSNEASLQPDRRLTATLLSLRGRMEAESGNLAAAENDYSQGAKILEIMDRNSENIPIFLFSVGKLQATMRKFAEAEKNFKRALDRREKNSEVVISCSHPDSVTILGELAVLYVHTQRYEEAERSFRQALNAIGEGSLSSHSHSRTILEDFADLLDKMGRNAEATDLRLQAQKIKPKN